MDRRTKSVFEKKVTGHEKNNRYKIKENNITFVYKYL